METPTSPLYNRLLAVCCIGVALSFSIYLPYSLLGSGMAIRILPIAAMLVLLSVVLLGIYVMHEQRRQHTAWHTVTAAALVHLLLITLTWTDPAEAEFKRAEAAVARGDWAEAVTHVDRAGAYGFDAWQAYALHNHLAMTVYAEVGRPAGALDAAARYRKVLDVHGFENEWAQCFLLAERLAVMARLTNEEKYLRGFLGELKTTILRAQAAGEDEAFVTALAGSLLARLGGPGRSAVRAIADSLINESPQLAAEYGVVRPYLDLPAPSDNGIPPGVGTALDAQTRAIRQGIYMGPDDE